MEENDLAVLILAFNRPAKLENLLKRLVFLGIKNVYLCCDGPRKDSHDDLDKIRQIRSVVNDQVQININAKWRKTNLGCKCSVINAVSWVLSENDAVIVIEDDCIPSVQFFPFMYKNLLSNLSEDVFAVSGSNLSTKNQIIPSTEYFGIKTKYFHCWGWGISKKNWLMIDFQCKFWTDFRNTPNFASICSNPGELRHWQRVFDDIALNHPDSWALPFLLNMWYQNKKAIVPSINLVSNLGFDSLATNTVKGQNINHVPDKHLKRLQYISNAVSDEIHDLNTFYQHFKGARELFPMNLFYTPYRIFKKMLRS